MSSSKEIKGHAVEMMNGGYVVDGKSYSSLEDIPDSIRKLLKLEDQDGNGVADLIDEVSERFGIDVGDKTKSRIHKVLVEERVQTFTSPEIRINGKKYDNLEELPKKLKEKIQKVFVGNNLDAFPELKKNLKKGVFFDSQIRQDAESLSQKDESTSKSRRNISMPPSFSGDDGTFYKKRVILVVVVGVVLLGLYFGFRFFA